MNRPFPSARLVVRRYRQQGFTLLSAIFLLVVLTLLGAAMVTISTSQQAGFAVDLMGTRAYAAARAGIEWGLYQVNSSNGWNYSTPNTRACPANPSNFVSPAPTLSAFTVTVRCAATPDANNGPTVYQIDVVACNAPAVTGACPGTPGPNYVERYLRVTL
jgi:MSHA biogenesis protein MshP